MIPYNFISSIRFESCSTALFYLNVLYHIDDGNDLYNVRLHFFNLNSLQYILSLFVRY